MDDFVKHSIDKENEIFNGLLDYSRGDKKEADMIYCSWFTNGLVYTVWADKKEVWINTAPKEDIDNEIYDTCQFLISRPAPDWDNGLQRKELAAWLTGIIEGHIIRTI